MGMVCLLVLQETTLNQRENPARQLAGAIEKLAADGRHYRPDEWLRFLTQDVLAGFGKRLEVPWDEARHAKLSELTQLYAKLVCEHPWHDILGPAYMELGSHGQRQWLAQYFTPQPIAGAMARMTMCDLDLAAFEDGRLIRVMEPSAGSGVMMLATCEAIVADHGADALSRFSFSAIDLDPLCTLMTACQLLANAFIHGTIGELVVYQGNALGPDSDLDVVVHMVAASQVVPRATPIQEDQPRPVAVPVLPAKAPERIAAIREAVVASGQQMNLFGDDALPVSAVPERRRRRA